jgi:CheY-like chemotaxis protein
MKILVVDDMEQNRYLLQKLLEGYGYAVETASNGVDAIEKARASPPDMVITDSLMPRMDGFQLCRELKKDEELRSIPVLFYSGTYTDKESRKLALDIGAIDYLTKPIEPDEFIKIVKEALDKYGKGELKPTEKPLEEKVYMKLYNERLIQKLEKKMLDLEQSEKRIRHLNSVLKASRTVTQLIVVEWDRDSLLQKACDALVEARDYDAAWLGFLSDSETFATVKGSCFKEDFSRFREHLIGGEHLPCFKNALAQKDPFMLVDKSIQCGDCFFKNAHTDKEVAIIRIEHANRLFGLLAISFAPDVPVGEEEKGLLKEGAGDIGFALHDMEMEEARKRAEEELKHTALSLQEHVEKLEEAKKKITEAYRLKEHFLKETSHRIITPVAIIGGHTELLLESSNLDDDQKEKIRSIRERNEEVEKLVQDALAGKYLEEEEGEG